MIKALSGEELDKRIALNFERLANDRYYQIDQVFSPKEYDWYGDKEGRALLAFVSHYKINGSKLPTMDLMIQSLPEKVNESGYFGPVYSDKTHEQQLSGHSWLLRGLCEYYEQFHDDLSFSMLNKIAENLYLSRAAAFGAYPVDREDSDIGGVAGSSVGDVGEWILSSDIGCAFMSIDGLSHVYKVTGKESVKSLVRKMCEIYLAIDKLKLKAQIHCTLTAARGMIRMYHETKDNFYYDGAQSIFKLYTENGGITKTYQNLNWWGRPDSWTEPCGIVDSIMLALELYKISGEEGYRSFAAKAYHNGLATAQRSNGGAGTDTIILDEAEHVLYAQMYEAFFCCTMRLSEGLWYIHENSELLYVQVDGKVSKKGNMYFDGDIIYAEVSGGAEAYVESSVELDGHILSPIVKYYKVPEDIIVSGRQRIIFD